MKLKVPKIVSSAIMTLLITMIAMPVMAQFGSVTRPDVDLPEGPVRNVILKSCISCHGIDDYAFHAMSRPEWQDSIDSWHEGKNLALSGRDESVLLDYLADRFGPESVPFPREYVPPEIDTFFSDTDARVFLEGVCRECHEIRVFDTRDTVEGWRALVLDMRERGASIDDMNLERLVEWLGRVRGTNPVE